MLHDVDGLSLVFGGLVEGVFLCSEESVSISKKQVGQPWYFLSGVVDKLIIAMGSGISHLHSGFGQ